MRTKKIAIIFGTRPEIIKMAPIINECQKQGLPYFCIHTSQHYSYKMDKVFLRELSLPTPHYRLKNNGKNISGHGGRVGFMISEIEKILLKEKPDVVLVQGDTNTVLAGALSAVKIPITKLDHKIRLAHVEAGLRSYDRLMPEEINRVVVDHISDFLFAPTGNARKILLREGINKKDIFVVGNTIVDTVFWLSALAKKYSKILKKLSLKSNQYILFTLHRQENVDVENKLRQIIEGVSKLSAQQNLSVIFSVHPRTEKMLHHFNISIPKTINKIKPLGYLDFISLVANARLVMTDSGGVQEEACILLVPCVTLRSSTERPETVDIGANIVAGIDSNTIFRSALKMMKKNRNWKNPFGNGKTAEKIIDIISR